MENNKPDILSIITCILTILMTGGLSASGQDATEIVQKARDKMEGESSQSIMTMTIVRPDWTREVKMKAWALGTEYSLILIQEPARDKGVAFLKRDKEIWNWQPTIDRVVKLPPSMMMQSWMGSDFTNDDLVKESSVVNDYEHKLLSDTTINSYDAYKIEMIPNEDAAVVWGKIISYISKDEYLNLMSRYYDEDGYLINTLKFSNVREIGGRVIPTKLEMIPAENPNQSTIIEYLDMEFNIDIKTSFFSLQNMKRVR